MVGEEAWLLPTSNLWKLLLGLLEADIIEPANWLRSDSNKEKTKQNTGNATASEGGVTADEGDDSRPTALINFVSEVLAFVATVCMLQRFVLYFKVLEGCLIYAL